MVAVCCLRFFSSPKRTTMNFSVLPIELKAMILSYVPNAYALCLIFVNHEFRDLTLTHSPLGEHPVQTLLNTCARNGHLSLLQEFWPLMRGTTWYLHMYYEALNFNQQHVIRWLMDISYPPIGKRYNMSLGWH